MSKKFILLFFKTLKVFEGSPYGFMRTFFGIFISLIALNFMVIMITLANAGQELTNSCKRCGTLLEDSILSSSKPSEFPFAQVWTLSKWFGRSAAIRPLDAFDLGKANILSTFGLILTYVFVLLQFKLGQ